MKQLLLSITLLALMTSCARRDASMQNQDQHQPERMSLTIDFQTGFTGHWIQLKVGEEHVYAGAVTTDNRIGLAGRLRLTTPFVPQLPVTVTVDRSKHYPFQVSLERGSYLGLSRNLNDGSIHLAQNREPFVYD
jgi:hypothetical protein